MKTLTWIAIVTGLGVWAFYNHLVLVVVSSTALLGVVSHRYSLYGISNEIFGKGCAFGLELDSTNVRSRIRTLEDEIKDLRSAIESDAFDSRSESHRSEIESLEAKIEDLNDEVKGGDGLAKTTSAELRILRDAITRIDRHAIRTFEAIVEEDEKKEREYYHHLPPTESGDGT